MFGLTRSCAGCAVSQSAYPVSVDSDGNLLVNTVVPGTTFWTESNSGAILAYAATLNARIAPTAAVSTTPIYTGAAGASTTLVLATGVVSLDLISWEISSSTTYGVVATVTGMAANGSGAPIEGGNANRYHESMPPVGATGATRYLSSTFGGVKLSVVTQ
jgi:hypothetical protein